MTVTPRSAIGSAIFDERIRSLDGGLVERADAERFVAALGRHIGLPQLQLDEAGEAEFVIDGEVELSLVHLPHLPGLVICAPVPNVPVDRPEYLKILMQANMSWRLTRGGAFVMLPGRDEVMLCWLVAIDHGDVAHFDGELADCVAFARFWKAEIGEAVERESQARQAEGSVPAGAVRA
jgi:hypothetical protein